MNACSPTNGRFIARTALFLAAFGLLAGLSYGLLKPSNNAVAQTFWQVHDDHNLATIDHSLWQAVLSRHLDAKHSSGINQFGYSQVDANSRSDLNSYLNQLATIDPRSYAKDEQMAYWINLYNALTVRLIIDNLPVDSITNLGEKLTSFGPWDDIAVKVAGKELSLNDIEHGILRPIWQDPRIHYAVNCASMGCPNLMPKAFTASNLEQQLELAAVDYVNHERGVSFIDDELWVSSIYHWYKVDFGDSDSTLIEHLASYAKPELKQQLEAYDGPVEHDYDWNLNGF